MALQLNPDQQNLISVTREPASWKVPNPKFTPSPFAYYNTYDNPALPRELLVDLRYKGWVMPNKFDNVLTQPYNNQSGAGSKFMVQPHQPVMMFRKPMPPMGPVPQKGSGLPNFDRNIHLNKHTNKFNSSLTQPF